MYNIDYLTVYSDVIPQLQLQIKYWVSKDGVSSFRDKYVYWGKPFTGYFTVREYIGGLLIAPNICLETDYSVKEVRFLFLYLSVK